MVPARRRPVARWACRCQAVRAARRCEPRSEPARLAVQGKLVRNKGPWKNIDDLETAVAEYIDSLNPARDAFGQVVRGRSIADTMRLMAENPEMEEVILVSGRDWRVDVPYSDRSIASQQRESRVGQQPRHVT